MEDKIIEIEVEGGLISNIKGIPKGYKCNITDRDCQKCGEEYKFVFR